VHLLITMSVARSALRPLIARADPRSDLARTIVSLPRQAAAVPIVASRAAISPLAPTAGVRWKSEAVPKRNAWAKEPIVLYEELKPITQQPSDVSAP
jgi:hypothetical protein